MEKNRKLIILILIVIVLIALGFFVKSLFTKDDAGDIAEDTTQDTTQEQDSPSDEELMDIINSMDGEDSEEKPHDLKLSIVGPEGETFEKSQARMYKAFIEGNGKYSNRKIRCNWSFYLNENNEEVLYETMENFSFLSEESKEVCGFTSTFINNRGVLRVVLDATIFNYVNGEEFETVTAERIYTVL